MSAPILVLNCGSSSIKFALFDGGVEPRNEEWIAARNALSVLRRDEREPATESVR